MKAKRLFTTILAGLLTASSLLTAAVLPAAADETPQEPTQVTSQNYVTVAQPVTHIVGDIAMVREINSKAEMEAVVTAETKPATALYTLNADLQALDGEGQPFATVEEILTAHNYAILAAFRVEDRAVGDALVAYLNEIRFYDCMLVASDPTLMQSLRTAVPTTFGVIDYTETYRNQATLTTEQCLDIRRSLKTHNGTVALLPAHLCTKDTVQYLYEHQVNVWTQIPDDPTAAQQYHALLSGAVGVITDATDSLLDIACHQLPENTMTRTPLNVGHRGIPSKAPECTVEGSLLAYEESANVVEMDVFLTSDGRVMAMHDITTGDTCNGNLHMEDCTYEELRSLYVNRGWEHSSKYAELRIPTLDEYMEAFKDTDCMLFIEIKSHKEEIVPIIRDMVNEYDMYDQCAVITFNTDTMAYMREYWPEMALGVLCEDYYGFMQGNNPEAELRTVMDFAGPYNGTVNPGWEAYGKDDIRAFLIRGISVNPWTFYGSKDYLPHFLDGFASMTGNDAHVIKRLTQYVRYPVDTSDAETGDTLSLKLNVTSYNRMVLAMAPQSILMLEGEDLVQVDGSTMTIVGEEGEISFVLGYTDRTLDYTVYTQPITITLEAEEETTIPETEAVVTDEPAVETQDTAVTTSEDTAPAPDDGCASTVSGVVLLIPALLGAVLPGWKKKDE